MSKTEESRRPGDALGDRDRLVRNASLAKAWLKETHSTLSRLKDLIIKVKEIATKMMGEIKHLDGHKSAKEVLELFDEILMTASNQDIGKDVSDSNQAMTPLFRREEGEGVYQADTERIELEIEPGMNLRINLVESNFLTRPLKTLGEDVDLDPGIDPNTPLADLNRGRGVNLGSIKVTKKDADMSWDVSLLRALTVGDVIDAINSSGIAGFVADIGTSRKGLKLTLTWRNPFIPGRELTISEAGGIPATDLGILTHLLQQSVDQPGSFEGRDLDPILTESTPISLLKGGHGLALGSIKIALGRTQRTVDLSSASTTREIIDAINDSIPGVIASFSDSKKGIAIESTTEERSLVVSDADDTESASSLGISGSPDLLGTLTFLMEGLNNENCETILKALETLNLSLKEISSREAETRTELKILDNMATRMIDIESHTIRVLSQIRGADVFKATRHLANQKSIYRSALKRANATIQPTLLDFIR